MRATTKITVHCTGPDFRTAAGFFDAGRVAPCPHKATIEVSVPLTLSKNQKKLSIELVSAEAYAHEAGWFESLYDHRAMCPACGEVSK